MNRHKIISFRANENEVRILDILAKRENRTASEMLRECVREAAEKRNLLPPGLVQFENFEGKNLE
jgi:predicted transcriptional regulator